MADPEAWWRSFRPKRNDGKPRKPKPAAEDVPRWSVPREWSGERCFILAGGASLKAQVELIPRLRGRIIAIKQTVLYRPDADVMFLASREDPEICRKYFGLYKGPRMVCRSNYPGFPERTLFLRRTSEAVYSRDPQYVGGFDAGSSALNLAALFGASEVVILGMDMCGGRWMKNHPLSEIPDWHFAWHMQGLDRMAPELKKDGVKVWNASPISRIPFFPKRPLSDFI